MTKYNLDLSTDLQTVKFHSEFGFALSRYAILVHGNDNNRALYHLDGLDKVDSMLEWLFTDVPFLRYNVNGSSLLNRTFKAPFQTEGLFCCMLTAYNLYRF